MNDDDMIPSKKVPIEAFEEEFLMVVSIKGHSVSNRRRATLADLRDAAKSCGMVLIEDPDLAKAQGK